MSITAGSLNFLLPVIERLTRLPGRVLAIASGCVSSLALFVGWGAGRSSGTVWGWWPFVMALVFAGFVGLFAVLRFRLARAVDATIDRLTTAATGTSDVTVLNEDGSVVGTSHSFDDEVARVQAAQRRADAAREAANKRPVFLPRIEAAQRAAIAGAGGVEKAPYLKDDLRLTIVSAVMSLAAIPVGIFLIFVGIIIWL